MLDHVGLIVSDLEASKVFYNDLLSVIDYKILVEHNNWLGYGIGKPIFWIGIKDKKFSNGHIAFQATKIEQVNNFYSKAIHLGASSNGEPRSRNDFYPNYYGAFILDRDNHSIGIIFHN